MKSNFVPRPGPGRRRRKSGNVQYTGYEPGKGGVPTFEDGTPIPWNHPQHPRNKYKKRPPKPGNH